MTCHEKPCSRSTDFHCLFADVQTLKSSHPRNPMGSVNADQIASEAYKQGLQKVNMGSGSILTK